VFDLSNGVKNAFAIQALNAFIAGTVYIVLPLLMLDRGISIESMGLIFAILPLVSQTTRLLFGITSDYIGRKKFYFFNGLMNMAFLGVYYLATTPLGFLLGKVSEGIRNASLWSVNRAYFMDHSNNKEKILIKMRGVNSVFEAFGTLLAGFLIILLFYEKTLILLIGLSIMFFPNVKMLKDKVKRKISPSVILKALDFRHKGKKFKNFMAIFVLIGLSWGFITGYIMPLFLKTMGVPVETIGLLLGVRILFNGISLYVFSSIWTGKRKILVGGLLFSLLLALLSFSNYATLPILIVLLGAVSGVADAGYESIFVSVVDHNSLGRDIGILLIGTHLGVSITQALSGFVITSFGFPTLFFMSAMLYTLFSLTAYYNMNNVH